MPSGLISQTGVRYATNAAYNNYNLLGGYGQNDTKTATPGADTMGSTKHTLTYPTPPARPP